MNQSISTRDYEVFRGFLEDACGIVLGDNKQYLVASRLNRVLRELELDSVAGLVDKAKCAPRSGLRERIIDAMTTNETFWFRDNHPYTLLKDFLLPELSKIKRVGGMKIWSAASSSGQEAYSISMVIQEYLQGRPGSLPGNVQIVGTDISPTMLDLAKSANYDNLALSRGLSPERKRKFFTQTDDLWQVNADIRSRARFSELNLMNSYASLGKFDIVFCRNVLIYFSSDLKKDIIHRISQTLNPGGYLFLGSTETIASYSDAFETVRHGGGIVYQLKEGVNPAKARFSAMATAAKR